MLLSQKRKVEVFYEWIIGNRYFPSLSHLCTLFAPLTRWVRAGREQEIGLFNVNSLCVTKSKVRGFLLRCRNFRARTAKPLLRRLITIKTCVCGHGLVFWWLFTSLLLYVYSWILFGHFSRGACLHTVLSVFSLMQNRQAYHTFFGEGTNWNELNNIIGLIQSTYSNLES